MKKIMILMTMMMLLTMSMASAIAPIGHNLPGPWLGENAYDGDNDTHTNWHPADIPFDLTYNLAAYSGQSLTAQVIWSSDDAEAFSPTVINAFLDCEGNNLFTQEFVDLVESPPFYYYSFSKRTTGLVAIPEACLIDGSTFRFSSDSNEYFDLDIFEIFVEVAAPSNTEPVINSLSPATRVELKAGDSQIFSADVTDTEDDANYTWTLGGVEVSTSETYTASWDDIVPGIYTLQLEVADAEYSDTASTTLEIRARGGAASGGSITANVVEEVADDDAGKIAPVQQSKVRQTWDSIVSWVRGLFK